jgi:thiamine-monophosphate kinase
MNERAIVRWLAKIAPAIGDDCAVLPNGRTDLLVTTDQFIEDVHFRRRTHTAGDVGWAALARGLSDIAAMGGEPRYAFVSIALPAWADERWLRSFYRGLLALAQRSGVELSGGDLSHAPKFYCDCAVIGDCPRGKALRRAGAKPGDYVYVSGPLGRPKKRPQPRLEIGRSLRGVATACMDVSDGLSMDLARLCEASAVGAQLETIPIARGATLEQALHRGEDYELLFTASRRLDFPRLGRITVEPDITLAGRPLPQLGYDHFARRVS